MNDITNINHRAQVIKDSRRIVVKVGSRLLTDVENVRDGTRIEQLVSQIHELRKLKYEVILVTSGAISTGMEISGKDKRPRDLPGQQALAAIGQSLLMSRYETASQKFGFHCAQILLSYDDLRSRRKHLNLCNCLNSLLAQNILPVINENDTVSVEEISFGDNDKLAALVATMTRADLTVLLTTVDGLLRVDEAGTRDRLPLVREIDEEIRSLAQGTDGNHLSTGGMITKIAAAEICMASGESLWIANGKDFGILSRISNAEDVGTLFYPERERIKGRHRWMAFFTDPRGAVAIDDGAVAALIDAGKSLLPSGIVKVIDEFDKGDTITIIDSAGKTVGIGISNYGSTDLGRIKGMKTSELASVIDKRIYDEVIHRDNMLV